MVSLALRPWLIAGVLVFGCSSGEDLSDSRGPQTTLPAMTDGSTGVAGSTGEVVTSGGEAASSSGDGEDEGTTTSTQLTEGTGVLCPPGTLFCPCGPGCEDGLSCIEALCQAYACGNGVPEPGEDCDDGDDDLADECVSDCKAAVCGDGFLYVGVEQCDDGAANADDAACKLDCTPQACGDGSVGPGESCDDGNQVNDDDCTNACAMPGCGDGAVQNAEQCDDGNQSNTDACLNACVLPSCGDLYVQEMVEECDDGNPDNGDGCVAGCKLAKCGDGFLQAGVEQCDDANVNDGDGCDAQCQKVAQLVGNYNVHSGPGWGSNPPTYTCKEACALLFGGVAGDYACSVDGGSVTGTAFLSGWGDGQYCTAPQDDDFKVNTFYNCGGVGCSYSAYVSDHCGQGTSINYCWKP